MTDSRADSDERLEQLIEELRQLADEAEENVKQRRDSVDMSEVDPAHMALAEQQGMNQAFRTAWQIAIGKREGEDGE